MSFIGKNDDARVFAPGYFLASADCERKTFTMKQADAITTSSNNKIVKGGTVYSVTSGEQGSETTDYIGIIYEDIDVTSGDMPGSVVTKGVVYEDRLPEAVDTYSSATVPTGGNPKELGLYERSGTSPNYVYTLTTDTTAADGKTYYSYDGKKIASAAKTALEAKGFVFMTSPAVTRPFN